MQTQSYSRKQRVADQINREVASLLLTELSDPRTQGLTVSGVELTPDMRIAHVFIYAPDHSDVDEIIKTLNHAAGFLRHKLAKRVRLRYLPQLQFRYDSSLDRSDRIASLLKAAAAPK